MGDYDTDILLWSERQASLLRQHASAIRHNEAVIDWPNIIEEIESVGRSERLALESHVRTVIEHLAKLQASPAVEPSAGWRQTVLRARAAIDAALEESPSLRSSLDTVIERETRRVRPLVSESLAHYGEASRMALEDIAFNAEQVLGPWWPDDPD